MEKIATELLSVIKIKKLSKFGRFLHNPYKYCKALYIRFIYYPLTKKGVLTNTQTFFGKSMKVLLPAGTDIFLTGGKSHDSEIRLSMYMINQLQPGDTFVDVGAHFGFFSVLASEIVGSAGSVFSYEGGEDTFAVLNENVKYASNIKYKNKVVSNVHGKLYFYQFPTAYSEYNSLDIEQYKDTDWIKRNPPKSIEMDSVRLSDELINLSVNIIKIDVEGGELVVLNGLEEYLINENPIIVLEYLSSKRKNQTHVLAAEFLESKGYIPNTINATGELLKCEDVRHYMESNNIESDNIVFLRS